MPEFRPDNAQDFAHIIQNGLLKKQNNRNRSAIKQQLNQSLESGDYGHALRLLTELKDHHNGITHIHTKTPQGTEVLIRDARWAIENPSNHHFGQAMMIVNYVRAAKKLIELHGGDPKELDLDLIKVLNELESAYYQGGEKKMMQFVATFNNQLNKSLANLLNVSENESSKYLNKTKDFVNLDDPSQHVVTIDSIPYNPNHFAFQAETILTELSDEQIAELNNRANSKWYLILLPFYRHIEGGN